MEKPHMNADTNGSRSYGFVVGLAAGTCVGAGLALWLAPRLSAEIRERATESAQGLRERASKQYDEASARVSDVVEQVSQTGKDVRNDAADAVVRGARAVGRYAETVKTS
jgi:gas vesicle protein